MEGRGVPLYSPETPILGLKTKIKHLQPTN